MKLLANLIHTPLTLVSENPPSPLLKLVDSGEWRDKGVGKMEGEEGGRKERPEGRKEVRKGGRMG